MNVDDIISKYQEISMLQNEIKTLLEKINKQVSDEDENKNIRDILEIVATRENDIKNIRTLSHNFHKYCRWKDLNFVLYIDWNLDKNEPASELFYLKKDIENLSDDEQLKTFLENKDIVTIEYTLNLGTTMFNIGEEEWYYELDKQAVEQFRPIYNRIMAEKCEKISAEIINTNNKVGNDFVDDKKIYSELLSLKKDIDNKYLKQWDNLVIDKPENDTQISHEDLKNLESYMNNAYVSINNDLRKGNKTDEAISISKILSHSDKYAGHTWRGMTIGENCANFFQVGDIISDRAFLSTSIEKDIALKFTHKFKGLSVLMKIIGYSGVDVSVYNVNQRENEILFDRNSQFEIINISQEKKYMFIIVKEVYPYVQKDNIVIKPFSPNNC
jgi:hypothetical protein